MSDQNRYVARLAACIRRASTQYGVISRAQARAEGLSDSSINRLLSSGVWTRLWPNAYALWVPSDPPTLWRHRLMAGSFWLGDSSSISHRAAALLLEWDGVESAPLEYSSRRHKRTPRPGIVVHRVRVLGPSDLISRQGFTITNPVRTLGDLASVLDALRLERALESALRRGDVSLRELSESVPRMPPNMPGRKALRALVEGHPGKATESDLETVLWQLMRAANLPLPVRQYWVLDESGRRVARADFAFVELRLIVEADGYGSHSKPEDWKRDRWRQNALVRLGWTVYRVTYEDAHRRPEQVVREIGELLRSRVA